MFGRSTEGGVVRGAVNLPYGARTGDLNVVIRGQDGKVLADGVRASACIGRAGGGCGMGPSPDYRLTGLPLAAVPVTAVLMQLTRKGQLVEADRADFMLDPSGSTTAPVLTAVPDLPQLKTSRGSIYGQINFRGPFAPGARRAGDLDVPPRDLQRLSLELRRADGKLIRVLDRFTKTPLGYTGYEMTGLDPCENCTLSLLDPGEGKKPVSSATVTVPDVKPSLVRRDFNYARAGGPEFLSGAVLAGDIGARGLRVIVTDAASGEKLAGTDEGDQACKSGLRCPKGDTMLYRIAEVPPDRDVILTLQRKGTAVDTQRVHTAPADEITQAPLLVLPRGKGPRSIQGTTLNGGPFQPGLEPADPRKDTTLEARLLGSDQTEIARRPARLPGTARDDDGVSYYLDNLPECQGCTVELLRSDGVVEDRVAVDVRADSPSVTVADLRWGALSGGSYVEGRIVLRQGFAATSELAVQVLDANGKVLADSTRIRPGAKAAGISAVGRSRGPFSYRLGGIPRDADKVKVVVFDPENRKKRLASTTVTLAVGGADTKVPDLKVDIGGRKS